MNFQSIFETVNYIAYGHSMAYAKFHAELDENMKHFMDKCLHALPYADKHFVNQSVPKIKTEHSLMCVMGGVGRLAYEHLNPSEHDEFRAVLSKACSFLEQEMVLQSAKDMLADQCP